MASEYGYCTEADIEARGNWDFSAMVSPISSTVIDANISQSERQINTKAGTSFTGTIPDAIKYLAIELTYRRIYNHLVWIGLMDRENPKKEQMPIWDTECDNVLEPYKAREVTPIRNHRMYSNDQRSIFQ